MLKLSQIILENEAVLNKKVKSIEVLEFIESKHLARVQVIAEDGATFIYLFKLKDKIVRIYKKENDMLGYLRFIDSFAF